MKFSAYALGAVLLLLSPFLFSGLSQRPDVPNLARSLLVQHTAAVRASGTNAGLTGVLTPVQIAAPAGFTAAGSWTSLIDRGAVITWVLPAAGSPVGSDALIADLLAEDAGGTVGRKVSGSFQPARGGTAVPLTALVPDGAVVVLTQVRPAT